MPPDAKTWIDEWFKARNPDGSLGPNENFVDKGVVDSFGIVELIEQVEAAFHIRFTDDDFQRTEMMTQAGLTAIVSEKLTR